jgi:hypothetical protein
LTLINFSSDSRQAVYRRENSIFNNTQILKLKLFAILQLTNDLVQLTNDFLEFLRQYTAFLESQEFYKCQIRIPRTFSPQKGSFLHKNRIFATFRFNTQYAFPELGKRLFASKMSNLDVHMFLSLEESFPEKIFEKFFT